MKTPFVSELEPDRPVAATFLVHNKEVRQKKSGEPYLSLSLSDRTGEVDAKMWDNVVDIMETFDRGDFVKVKGILQIFHNRPQLTLHKVQRVEDGEVDFTDYFPASRRNPDEMLSELRGIVAGIGNRDLRGLLEAILGDEEIARRYKTAPAAKSIHHAWLGGLIEHVLSLCALCRMTASHYPWVDLDLLLTGAALHDLGKIHELSYERGFGYTTEGQLLGHMAIALRIVAAKLSGLPDFPPRLRTLVEHMILSHHGKLEFGSPKVPQFPEALLLHYLDDLDSKMECMRSQVERDPLVNGDFTAYSAPLDRSVLKKEKYLEGSSAPKPLVAEPSGPPVAQKPPGPVRLGTLGEKLLGALKREN
ncbi:MAG: HD domain-containing protein [Acidobacteria bacterium]|nr:HD domain-containing protein [Acidobacteriota bacterium]